MFIFSVKKYFTTAILFISWELNAQVALPTFQGVHKALSLITLDFNDSGNLGLTLDDGPGSDMSWSSDHIYCEGYTDEDPISFTNPTYVESFQMNNKPYSGYSGGSGWGLKIVAFDASDNVLWHTIVDLTNYGSWSNWLTVTVQTSNIKKFIFYSPNYGMAGSDDGAPEGAGSDHTGSKFWPSIDNMIIAE